MLLIPYLQQVSKIKSDNSYPSRQPSNLNTILTVINLVPTETKFYAQVTCVLKQAQLLLKTALYLHKLLLAVYTRV